MGYGQDMSCFLCLLFVLPDQVWSNTHQRLRGGFKQERINDKYHLTSTEIGSFKPIQLAQEANCLRLDLHVPESYDPLPLCLKERTGQNTMAGFHKNFSLRLLDNDTPKVMTLSDILTKHKAVNGFVIGIGVSHINGYLNSEGFYGMLAYRHFSRDQIIHCSILPIRLLSEFADMTSMDDEEQEEFIYKKTVKEFKGEHPNAIVACGDMHREDDQDIENQFYFDGPSGPSNVKQISKRNRSRRQLEDNPSDSEENSNANALNSEYDMAAAPPAALPPDLQFSELPGQSNKEPKVDKAAAKAFKKLTMPDKHGTYFASVCYIIDNDYLIRRFNGSAEEATLLFGGFVEIADWILRATDWNMDGIPENIGVRLLQVDIQYITRELKGPDEKWGRSEDGRFEKRAGVFSIIREIGRHMAFDCDIRSGIGEVNVAKYVLHEPGGCTACKGSLLTSFTNPYVEKFSPRGEQLRLMYHQIRILTFGMVHTDNYCGNCSGSIKNGRELKQSIVAGTFENEDSDWGACIVEGDIQSRSNIPLNSFRLSVCGKESGVRCLKELAARNNCMEFEPEEQYCGNGIVEGDEECDCGTLATCVEQQCTCSPRSGRSPCRLLSEEESNICLTLIRCRGFRFLHELGRSNGSNFLPAFKTFVDGTNFKMGDRASSRGGMLLTCSFNTILCFIFTFAINRYYCDHFLPFL